MSGGDSAFSGFFCIMEGACSCTADVPSSTPVLMFMAHEFRVAQAVPTPPKFLTRRCRRSEIICSPNAAATADNL